ncbi:PTS system mannose/fructose/sorbose family transporter subunit IID [Enterococcus avium]
MRLEKEAAQRHLEFFNTAPPLSTFIMGIVVSMEEENAKNPENFDTATITSIKTALMGPLAGIGDSLFWGTLLVIGIGVGASFSKEGNILGPILFLLIFNVPNFLLRYFGVMQGYKFGTKLLENIESSGVMKTLTHAASILGLMVIGGMSGSMVSIQVAGSIGQGRKRLKFKASLMASYQTCFHSFVYYLFIGC